MKLLHIGITMVIASTLWLVIAGKMGESPLEYYMDHPPWYFSAENVHTVLFHIGSTVML